jgi:hypothetical protein
MLASVLQSASAVRIPGTVAQTLSQCGFGPVFGKIGLRDLQEKMIAAGISVHRRMEAKAFFHDVGLLVP